jgi:ketosteroid isomerase-like protein
MNELMTADRAFAAAVDAAAGVERARVWAGWFAPDGRQILPGRVVTGREDVAALMAGAFGDPDYHLRWEPDRAGDHWTSGRYTSTSPGPDGPVTATGRYLTVWTRTPEGWRVAVDTGVPDPAAD